MIDNKKLIIIPILLFLLFTLSYIKITTKNDSTKFKEEYESLNKTNYKVAISSNNNIKYSNYKEIFNVLENKTGIIFLGYKEDDNSRYAINILLKVLKKNNNKETIYYLDIHNDMDSYVIENNKLVYAKDDTGKDIKGTKNYFKLIKYLDNYLGDYIIMYEDKEYPTNEKRIPIPFIIFVENGKIKSAEYIYMDISEDEVYNLLESYVK